jgi:SnoaL-like domain
MFSNRSYTRCALRRVSNSLLLPLLIPVLCCVFFVSVFSQAPLVKPKAPAPQPGAKSPLNADKLALEWIRRVNALGNWNPASDVRPAASPARGRGGAAVGENIPLPTDPRELVDRFVELYDPGVLQFTGPNERQLGSVTYSGIDAVRKWAETFAHTYSDVVYRINPETVGNQTVMARVLTFQPPWGGLEAGIETTAIYTVRATRKRYFGPGAVFFRFTESGKINRARLYLQADETVEQSK